MEIISTVEAQTGRIRTPGLCPALLRTMLVRGGLIRYLLLHLGPSMFVYLSYEDLLSSLSKVMAPRSAQLSNRHDAFCRRDDRKVLLILQW